MEFVIYVELEPDIMSARIKKSFRDPDDVDAEHVGMHHIIVKMINRLAACMLAGGCAR